MITSAWWRRGATTSAALALVLASTGAPAAAGAIPPATSAATAQHRQLPEPPPADQARAELDELAVEAPHSMDGYSREKFPHWIKQYGTCDTREVVLQRDGRDVVQDDQCRAVAGGWVSVYDDKVFTDAKALDIDHLVSARRFVEGSCHSAPTPGPRTSAAPSPTT
ncbi:hypothetical protein [Kitasatospora sp. NPDC006786]|uniref:hypothetical protein n=1 Tax=unclassified Kitasatospora TaxID=2633591 RepID=UPI0033F56F3F